LFADFQTSPVSFTTTKALFGCEQLKDSFTVQQQFLDYFFGVASLVVVCFS
jgi:hypothetical protein